MRGIGSGSFDPETLVILETAFDEAWITLKANGNGNITVTTGSNATITGSLLYGIEALSNGRGNIAVTTATGDTINSGSVGINVYNQATSIPQVGGLTTSLISVTSNGTINSGTTYTGSGGRPAGILAGYKGGTTNTPNSTAFGNVTVDNFANINAAGGDGIRAYNFGPGDVTINNHGGTIVAKDMKFTTSPVSSPFNESQGARRPPMITLMRKPGPVFSVVSPKNL